MVEYPYGMPSPYEANVVRRNVDWLTADRIASISFTPLADLSGIITPNGVCFERHHGGCADINPDEHRLMIHGMVDRPLIFTMDELTRFPSVSRIHFLECPANGGMEWKGAQMTRLQYTHGMIHCCEWTGVPLSVLLDECGVRSGVDLARLVEVSRRLERVVGRTLPGQVMKTGPRLSLYPVDSVATACG